MVEFCGILFLFFFSNILHLHTSSVYSHFDVVSLIQFGVVSFASLDFSLLHKVS